MTTLRDYFYEFAQEWAIDELEHDIDAISAMEYEAFSTQSLIEVFRDVLLDKLEDEFEKAQEYLDTLQLAGDDDARPFTDQQPDEHTVGADA